MAVRMRDPHYYNPALTPYLKSEFDTGEYEEYKIREASKKNKLVA
jgi:hypothetical protein